MCCWGGGGRGRIRIAGAFEARLKLSEKTCEIRSPEEAEPFAMQMGFVSDRRSSASHLRDKEATLLSSPRQEEQIAM